MGVLKYFLCRVFKQLLACCVYCEINFRLAFRLYSWVIWLEKLSTSPHRTNARDRRLPSLGGGASVRSGSASHVYNNARLIFHNSQTFGPIGTMRTPCLSTLKKS